MTPSNAAIQQHIAYARAGGMSENTIRARIWLLSRVDGAIPWGLMDATAEDLADWLSEPDWSRQTKVTYYNHLHGFYAWAVDNGLRVAEGNERYANPVDALRRPTIPRRPPRPIESDVLHRILTTADNPWRRHFLLAAYAGMRCMEIATIRRADITEDAIRIRGKGEKTRVVPTHPLIWQDVQSLPAGLICPMPRGLRVRPAYYVSSYTTAYLRSHLGIYGVTMHQGRHWFGTQTLRACRNLRTVQELMGHSSPAATALYTLISDEERRAAITALPTMHDAAPIAR